MVKTIQIIILSTFLGCSDSNFMLEPVYEDIGTTAEKFSQVFYFDENSRLDQDDNGYYHLTMDKNNWQTLHRVTGSIKNSANMLDVENFWVEWESNLYWYIGDTLGYVIKRGLTDDLVYVNYDTTYVTWFNGFEVPTSNQMSYSNNNGTFHNMIAPVNSMVGDTMKLTAYWYDGSRDFYIVLD